MGAGGFGREVFDVVDAINAAQGSGEAAFEVVGYLDDGQPDPALLEPFGVGVLGGMRTLEELPADVQYVIGIGAPGTRRSLDAFGRSTGRTSATLVHPQATVGRAVTLGEGCVVCSHVSITTNIRIGRHVHVNINSTVGHDVVIGDHVTLSPLVAVSGNVTLEDAVFIGTGATLNPGITVGAEAVIGSGAAVLKSVAAGVTAVGVPAKPR